MLALEIEYLTGNVVASTNDSEPNFDWPPQPDRIFSALVASWGARGQRPQERKALEWIESQEELPRIFASEISRRTTPTVFVPPNDFKTSQRGLDVIPVRRQRQARSFPAGRPIDDVVRLVWPSEPSTDIQQSLDALARDTAYLGHSSSVTRCRFITGEYDLAAGQRPRYAVYPGRLDELERLFHAGRRPGHGEVVTSGDPGSGLSEAASVFSADWIVLSDNGDRVPDLRLSAVAAKKLRDALMGAYERVHGEVPPEWLSGHRPGGEPSEKAHCAILPMADVGWPHSEGRLFGLAIVPPHDIEPDALLGAISELMERQGADRRCIELFYGAKGPWSLSLLNTEESRSSLSPRRWVKAAERWATATPIVLDRFPKKRNLEERAQEIEGCIADACVNIGLPRPTQVVFSVVPWVRGAPMAVLPSNAPAWQRWQLPPKLQGRYLVHAQLTFERPIRGPVILGAGRYVGLGLCLPDEDRRP